MVEIMNMKVNVLLRLRRMMEEPLKKKKRYRMTDELAFLVWLIEYHLQ
jgi:hypothetical protein